MFKETIKRLREKTGLLQKEFAKKIEVSKPTISAWEQGTRTPSASQRKKLCEYFGISEAELFGAQPKDNNYLQKIPIISWINANKFKPIADPFPAGFSDEYVYADVKGKNIFCLRVVSDCMNPEFQEGDIIVINPHVEVNHNDYAIVADRDADTATFKQFKQYGNKKILHPLNPKYQDIELDHKTRYNIVGKVVQKIKKY